MADAADAWTAYLRLMSYNDRPYSAVSNPCGMDDDGHRINFSRACADIATVAQQTGEYSAMAQAAATQAGAWAIEPAAVSYLAPDRIRVLGLGKGGTYVRGRAVRLIQGSLGVGYVRGTYGDGAYTVLLLEGCTADAGLVQLWYGQMPDNDPHQDVPWELDPARVIYASPNSFRYYDQGLDRTPKCLPGRAVRLNGSARTICRIVSAVHTPSGYLGYTTVVVDGVVAADVASVDLGLEAVTQALIPASTAAPGHVELATPEEARAGVDASRAITPAGMSARIGIAPDQVPMCCMLGSGAFQDWRTLDFTFALAEPTAMATGELRTWSVSPADGVEVGDQVLVSCLDSQWPVLLWGIAQASAIRLSGYCCSGPQTLNGTVQIRVIKRRP